MGKKYGTRHSGLNASCYDRPVLAERFDTKKKNKSIFIYDGNESFIAMYHQFFA